MSLSRVVIGGAILVINVIIAVESVLSRSSLYRLPRDVILDSVLGRAEEFEFKGTTTPEVSPRSTP